MTSLPALGRRIGLSVLCACAMCYGAWLAIPDVPGPDDGFIALSSAQSVLRGSDPAFGVPALTGATSPAYVAALVALLQSGISPSSTLRAAAAASVVAFALSLWLLACAAGIRPFAAFPFVIVIIGSGQVWMVSANGLETGLALAVLTAVLASALANRRTLVALGTGVLPWLRPDMAPVAGVILLWTLWSLDWSARVRLVGLAILVAAPFALWLRLDTGAWTPQTMQAKYAFFAEVCWPLREKLAITRTVLTLWVLALVPASLGLLLVWRLRLGALGLAAAVLVLCGYAWFFPRGLSHNSLRYVYPLLLPWSALGWVVALQRWPREGVVVVAVAATVTLLFRAPQHEVRESIAKELVEVSAWLEQHVPHGAKLLVHDAGAVSVLTTHRLADLVGLKTPSSIGVHEAITLPSCGARRGEAVVEIARKNGADYLVVIAGWDKPFGLSTALAQAGMLKEAVRTPPDSWPNGYTVYRLQSGSDADSRSDVPGRSSYSPAAPRGAK